MIKKLVCLITVNCILFAGVSRADINFSGFASINAGKVMSGTGVPQFGVPPTFLADYPLVSAYSKDLSFKPESLFGLQISADLMDDLSITGQIVARGADDFDATIEWAYLSYTLNDNWTLQAGKKRLPLFYYSDFYDVGYAYVWMRPPADNYTWQIFNYNGVNALYSGEIGDWSVSGNLYYGEEDDKDNKLLSEFFFIEPTREIWRDMMGGVLQLNKDWFEVRLTHMTYKNERYRSGERTLFDGNESRTGKFYGLAINLDFEQFFVLTELNRLDLDGDLDTSMVSVGYRLETVTPYVSYSQFKTKGDDDGEKHNTTSVGLRWDFHSSAAIKIQFDEVKDESYNLAVAGDSKSITIGIDTVF